MIPKLEEDVKKIVVVVFHDNLEEP